MHQALVDSVACSMVLLPASANNTTRLSKFVSTRSYDFIEFHLLIGATDCTVDAKLQESVNADGSSASDVTGGSITQVSATGDNRMVVISVHKSALTKRYAGILVTISNATAALTSAEAFRWGKAGNLPEALESAGSNSYLTAEVIRVGAPS